MAFALQDIPTDINCLILRCFKPLQLVELSKGEIDTFLINHCYRHQPDKLLYAFVKKQRILSLNRLLKSTKPSNYAIDTVRTCFTYASRIGDFKSLSILTKRLSVFAKYLNDIPISCTVTRLLRIKDDMNAIKQHLYFIEYYVKRTTGVCERNPLNFFTLLRVLEHPHSTKILIVLLRHKIIHYMIKMTPEDSMFNELVNALIVNNHLIILKHFIRRGYNITAGDVVVALARSNLEMVKYMMHKFKPRIYSNNFMHWMLRLAHIRNDPRMSNVVEKKFTKKKHTL